VAQILAIIRRASAAGLKSTPKCSPESSMVSWSTFSAEASEVSMM
jgi:hypothetical protein